MILNYLQQGGKEFAEKFITGMNSKKINFVADSSSPRCREFGTIKPCTELLFEIFCGVRDTFKFCTVTL